MPEAPRRLTPEESRNRRLYGTGVGQRVTVPAVVTAVPSQDVPQRQQEAESAPVSVIADAGPRKQQNAAENVSQSVVRETADAVHDTDASRASDDARAVESRVKSREESRRDERVTKRRGRPTKSGASSETVQVRVSRKLFEEVRREFPNLTNRGAMEAFVALHGQCADLVEDARVLDAVKAALDGADADVTVTEQLRQLTKAVQVLRRESSVASMAAIAVLVEEFRRVSPDVSIESYIGVSDSLFEAMAHLLSMSTEYEHAVERARGRVPRGYGD